MQALCWTGVNKLAVENVPEPRILNDEDVIVKVRLTTTCGSDLHLLGGYIPAMRAGDVLGHEFMGEVDDMTALFALDAGSTGWTAAPIPASRRSGWKPTAPARTTFTTR